MADYRITCITKQPRNDPYHGITHFGFSNGVRWTKAQAIAALAAGHTLYTETDGKRASVSVYDDKVHEPHLRSHADEKWNNNLLSLPECS